MSLKTKNLREAILSALDSAGADGMKWSTLVTTVGVHHETTAAELTSLKAAGHVRSEVFGGKGTGVIGRPATIWFAV